MVKLEKTEDGTKLIIKIDHRCKDAMQDIKDMLEAKGSIYTWNEILESYYGNGWVNLAGQIALNSNEFMISDDVTYDDKGMKIDSIGRLYYYTNAAIRCPIEELLEYGEITLDSVE